MNDRINDAKIVECHFDDTRKYFEESVDYQCYYIESHQLVGY
ncbi:hypothetical protein THOM_2978 [Trachipleistophora hominis]|uniref:Uncharacterized protein n=1 Tax=Trachipleistophora hominis TaxID=72359 RepID=L7JRI6_TRAHO|nr:hypothetical protein THOM_2978 [Trachipleistophora hominis]